MPPYRVPTGQRIAALRDGTAIPDEFERHYLAALERGATLENAAKSARAAVETPAAQAVVAGPDVAAPTPVATRQQPGTPAGVAPPEPTRIEDLDPPLDPARRWYNPDPRHLTSVRRAVRPAMWVSAIVLVLQMIGTITGGMFGEIGLGYWTLLTIMTLVSAVTVLLMMGAFNGSAIAGWILLGLHVRPISRTIGNMIDSTDLFETIGLGLGLILALGMAVLWGVAAASLTQYRKSLKEAAAAVSTAH